MFSFDEMEDMSKPKSTLDLMLSSMSRRKNGNGKKDGGYWIVTGLHCQQVRKISKRLQIFPR